MQSFLLQRLAVYFDINSTMWDLQHLKSTRAGALTREKTDHFFFADVAAEPNADGQYQGQYLLQPVNGTARYFRSGLEEDSKK